MKQTDQTLLEQLRITEFEIENRQHLFAIDKEDIALIVECQPLVEASLDQIVGQFYDHQTSVPEIALLIGDADTLERIGEILLPSGGDMAAGTMHVISTGS